MANLPAILRDNLRAELWDGRVIAIGEQTADGVMFTPVVPPTRVIEIIQGHIAWSEPMKPCDWCGVDLIMYIPYAQGGPPPTPGEVPEIDLFDDFGPIDPPDFPEELRGPRLIIEGGGSPPTGGNFLSVPGSDGRAAFHLEGDVLTILNTGVCTAPNDLLCDRTRADVDTMNRGELSPNAQAIVDLIISLKTTNPDLVVVGRGHSLGAGELAVINSRTTVFDADDALFLDAAPITIPSSALSTSPLVNGPLIINRCNQTDVFCNGGGTGINQRQSFRSQTDPLARINMVPLSHCPQPIQNGRVMCNPHARDSVYGWNQ